MIDKHGVMSDNGIHDASDACDQVCVRKQLTVSTAQAGTRLEGGHHNDAQHGQNKVHDRDEQLPLVCARGVADGKAGQVALLDCLHSKPAIRKN